MARAAATGTTVAIIGSGPAGLTPANPLRRSGVDCVVLELRDRSHVEQRQRAGVLDHYAGQIFQEYGLSDAVLAGARLDRLFSSPPAAAAFADLMAGTALTVPAS